MLSCAEGLKTSSLTSMELQMLTSSCVKLQTVHRVPLSVNKDGESSEGWDCRTVVEQTSFLSLQRTKPPPVSTAS